MFKTTDSHSPAVCFTTFFVLALAAVLCLSSLAPAQTVSSTTSYVISNNTPGFIKQAVDKGAVDPSTVIPVTVWLKLHNQPQLNQLVSQQYSRGSASYHKWITQAQFNAGFSPTAQEVQSVQNFLTAHNLTVLTVAENNFYVKVKGTVGDIQKAFHVQIHNYNFKGAAHRTNTGNPSISSSAGAHVAAITGLDDLGFRPALARPLDADGQPFPMIPLSSSPGGVFFDSQCFRAPQTVNFSGGGNTATYTGNRYGQDISNTTNGHLPPCGYAPAELYTAYNMTALFHAGLNGTGETVVITDAFGSGTIRQDAELFSKTYGLPDLTPSNFQVLRAPGAFLSPFSAGWDTETTLDVEWVHAMAPGAKIVLVLGPTNHSDLDEAVNWAVIHHLGNTISNSWSTLEGIANPNVFNQMNSILQMAAAQGIDVNFATGDFGDETPSVGFKTVDFPASSPFATGIGGTSLALNPDNTIQFQTGWGNNLTRIANRATEGNSPVNPPLHLGFQFGAGGGTSLFYAKPSFQSSLPGTKRKVPDIGWLADPFTGVEVIQTVGGVTGVTVIGGTSLSTPMFSGLMAIAAQKAGHALGQAAPLVYGLPSGAVMDIVPVTSADNVTGTVNSTNFTADQLAAPLDGISQYFSALYNSPFSTRWFVITFGTDTSLTTGTGWDEVTGVGTPNGAAFVNAIVP